MAFRAMETPTQKFSSNRGIAIAQYFCSWLRRYLKSQAISDCQVNWHNFYWLNDRCLNNQTVSWSPSVVYGKKILMNMHKANSA